MYIGIDIGGTKIAAGIVEKDGRLKQTNEMLTPGTDDLNVFINELSRLIDPLIKDVPEIEKIGIGIPGSIGKNGELINIPNLPCLTDISLEQFITKLKEKHDAQYLVENDANCAALAELYYGSGKGLRNFVYLTISTGIGSGIILDGKLYKGPDGTAGELGHMIINSDGPQCNCGNRGCWEALGSGTALARMAQVKIAEEKAESKIMQIAENDIEKIDAKVIAEAAREKDELALDLFKINGYYNALAIANIVNILDTQAVVIGGGLSLSGEIFFKAIENALKMFVLMNPEKSINIIPAKYQNEAGMIGAAVLCNAEIVR